MKGRCRNCMLWREVRACHRSGGGTYRRGGRQYRSSVCEECARDLLSQVAKGQMSVSRWSIRGLRIAWPERNEES